MSCSVSFALGLLAYLRQAALSLHRAPSVFCDAMRSYYESHYLPQPISVVACIDAASQPDGGSIKTLLNRISGTVVVFDEAELKEIRGALRALEAVLANRVVECDSERTRIRLSLSSAEDLVRRKLGRKGDQVDKIEHLNESPGLSLRSLSELVGERWPNSA
jgi:hypothetical protein